MLALVQTGLPGARRPVKLIKVGTRPRLHEVIEPGYPNYRKAQGYTKMFGLPCGNYQDRVDDGPAL